LPIQKMVVQVEAMASFYAINQNRQFSMDVLIYLQVSDNKGGVSHFIDGKDPLNSNWMRYVNCAVSKNSCNLVAFQADENIFYRTVVTIGPNTELFVWYGDDYAGAMGLVDQTTHKSIAKAGKNINKTFVLLRSNTSESG
jgi:SET domain